MATSSAVKHAPSVPRRLSGMRWLVYCFGRGLQLLGLLLIWWVLLLFVGFAGMGVLLRWSLLAAIVFYTGWGCTMWAKRGARDANAR